MAHFNLESIFKSNGAKVNHSVFDLSKRMAFSLPCSYLTPIYAVDTLPNEHHRISLNGIMRTETMNTAAFVSGKVHCNFFFVPYSQLWHPFNSFVSQKKDLHSVRFQGSNYVPNIALYDIVILLRDLAQLPSYDANGGYPQYDMFGYNIFFHVCRLLQVCKYGNYYWMFGKSVSEINTWIDNMFPKEPGTSNVINKRYVNLFKILAYQHVFYDYYRNKFYDEYLPNGERYIQSFNVDGVVSNNVSDSHITNVTVSVLYRYFCVHPIQYKKDLFSSLMPSTQFGAVSSVSFDNNYADNLVFGGDAGLVYVDGQGSVGVNNRIRLQNDDTLSTLSGGLNDYTLKSTASEDYNVQNTSSFDVLSLRRAQLLQRWKQNALRAGNMVDDNFESHYGVKPYYEDDNNVRFLGSFTCELNVNPVTATSNTGQSVNGNVGDLAAIGVGSFQGREIDFQCKDFGVIIGVAAFLPDVYYSANGIDQGNVNIEPFDYPNPEFNNVGFEPTPLWRLTLERPNSGLSVDANIGYSSPWSYLKTNVDEVFDEFSSFQPYGQNIWRGSLSSWIFRRHNNFKSGSTLNVRMKDNLYVSPNVTDSVFGITFDGTPATNPFFFSCTLNHKAIRPLSVLGLPEF